MNVDPFRSVQVGKKRKKRNERVDVQDGFDTFRSFVQSQKVIERVLNVHVSERKTMGGPPPRRLIN